jgi:hypothetical protein
VGGEHDDRDPGSLGFEPLLQDQTAHLRHPHVEHQATRSLRLEGIQERGRGRMDLGPQTDGGDQLRDGIPHRQVVIDDEDRLLIRWCHALLPVA